MQVNQEDYWDKLHQINRLNREAIVRARASIDQSETM